MRLMNCLYVIFDWFNFGESRNNYYCCLKWLFLTIVSNILLNKLNSNKCSSREKQIFFPKKKKINKWSLLNKVDWAVASMICIESCESRSCMCKSCKTFSYRYYIRSGTWWSTCALFYEINRNLLRHLMQSSLFS